MRISIVFVLLLIILSNTYAQDEKDFLEFTFLKNSKLELYEGEFMYFHYCISNKTSDPVQVDTTAKLYADEIIDQANQLVRANEDRIASIRASVDKHSLISSDFQPGFSKCQILAPYSLFGNIQGKELIDDYNKVYNIV